MVVKDKLKLFNKNFLHFSEKEDKRCNGVNGSVNEIVNVETRDKEDACNEVTNEKEMEITTIAYIGNELWEMRGHKRNGVAYFDVSWTLATEDPRKDEGEGIHPVDANVKYCLVHRILMRADMDCWDSQDEGRRFYMELKTGRELDYPLEERYEREKLLKLWIIIHFASLWLSHAVVFSRTASNLRGLRMLALVFGSEIIDASVVAIALSYSRL